MCRVIVIVSALLFYSTAEAAASAAERLAAALRLKTISYQDREQIDYTAFRQLNDYLVETYPRVFGELDVEFVNDYSLLIRWPGSDPDLKPILFTAHTRSLCRTISPRFTSLALGIFRTAPLLSAGPFLPRNRHS